MSLILPKSSRYMIRYGEFYVSGTAPLKFNRHESSAMTFNEQRKDEVLAMLKLYNKNDVRAKDVSVQIVYV